MKKFLFLFFWFLFLFSAKNIFASNYVYYQPQVEHISVDMMQDNSGKNIVNKETYVNFDSSMSDDNKKFGRFFESNVICVAPELDGKSFQKEISTLHPFANLLPKIHYSDEKYIDFVKSATMKIPYLTGFVNNTEKQILNIKWFSLNPEFVASCGADLNASFDIRENVIPKVKSGDTFEYIVQFPVGTKFSAKFLSPILSAENFEIQKNFATFEKDGLKTLKLFIPFLCYKGDNCEIEKAEILLLNGEKMDYTEQAKRFKTEGKEFFPMDRKYFDVPVNTKSVKVWYQ